MVACMAGRSAVHGQIPSHSFENRGAAECKDLIVEAK